MFLKRVAATPGGRAFASPAPGDAGAPLWLTWSQVAARAKAIAAGLYELGVRPEDRVAILAGTRLEWVLADLGVMCAGAATTTVYPTTEPADAAFIVGDSGSKVLIAENPDQAAKVKGATLPDLAAIIVIDGEPGAADVPTLTLAELERRGDDLLARQPDLIERIVEGIGPDHLATLIYTSGTTGRPKGVELLHAGWVWQGAKQSDLGLLLPDDLQYLWLPLSHSFGKTLLCGVIYVGMPTYVDGRVDKIIDNLGTVRPTVMAAAPRVFEKVYNVVVTTAKAGGGAKWKIFTWALRVGKQVAALRQAGRSVPTGLAVRYAIADKLVFAKLRAKMGGRMRGLVSGSAPLAREIAEFFYAAGMPILEGYGLTETFAGSFVNRPEKVRVGTVGQPLGDDLEVRLDTDGEILLRGVPVMRGYHNLPAETAAAFTPDGFFRTGDIGEIDVDGYLRITDRKKDLIKTSGGKYVAPSHVEGLFKSICPYTSQAIVVGQARNYCTMLVTLDPEAIAGWAAGGPLEGRPYAEIVSSKEVRELVDGYVRQLNERLNRWETIKRFVILHRDLSIEDGELTPSMKVKRRVVEQKFADDIDQMYAGAVAQLS
ncbi:long-chain fatty acid--CoA ligase [Planosporangium thailandense]|uniref:Long-chain fatty acid--CoA ligase n=1 Tax=Planosporangium thailandense TaxID=765197 RepID=A0ABX0XXD6_9ACTN|nr:long-chain fatty acid--CoA ligase [Planosporangium thailandense]NJC69829.1 long-chain fatty acid--CoA ligase [Planosporangium thailandense]